MKAIGIDAAASSAGKDSKGHERELPAGLVRTKDTLDAKTVGIDAEEARG